MLIVVCTAIIIAGIIMAILLISKYIAPKMIVRKIEEYENTLLQRQFEEINSTYQEMRGWRHDYRNHMQVLKNYVEGKKWEQCLTYIDQINQDLYSVDHVIKTGNIMADAIVNSKVSMAKSKNIHLDVTAKVPENIPITDVEFCILFGNMMDNAIEACEKIDDIDGRFIRIYLGIFKKQFYISVVNSTNQKKSVHKFISQKGDGHGFGLGRIDKIIQEKNGYLNRKNEPGVFATEIMLPFVR